MCDAEIEYGKKWYCSWECQEAAKLQKIRTIYPNVIYRWTNERGSEVSTAKNYIRFRLLDIVNRNKYVKKLLNY